MFEPFTVLVLGWLLASTLGSLAYFVSESPAKGSDQ